MNLPKIENIGFIGIAIVVILAFFFFILGFSGMMAALGIILLFTASIYFILKNFELGQDEKLVFSFFLGVGIFPAITYWPGFLISFRASIFLSFIILIVLGFIVGKYKNKKHN